MLKDYLNIAVKSLRQRKMRSFLTVLGIVIGIGAIVALLTVSQGLENAVVEQFKKLGTDKVYVVPKAAFHSGNIPKGLTQNDLDTVERLSYFDFVTPFVMGNGNVEFSKEKQFISQIVGYPTDKAKERLQSYDIGLQEGRYFKNGEKYAAIIGIRFSEPGEIFEKSVRLGNKITIKETKFTVIGIFNSFGNSEDDSAIYIPVEAAREIFDKPDEISIIELNIKDGIDPNKIADIVKRKMESARDNGEFDVLTQEQFLTTFTDILMIVNVVLGGIAAISLVVGAVGIMTSMFTSVVERRKQIGIMKAIGARNTNILSLFMMEAAFIGAVGGFFGVILGIAIAKLVGYLAAAAGFQLLLIKISPSVIILGMIFAVGISVLSGIFPSYMASRLHPVEAMRK